MLVASLVASGCGSLENVGRAPALAPIELPPAPANVAPVSKDGYPATPTGSLHVRGRSGLYADNRARQVGDLLTVLVAIDDGAVFENGTDRTRSNASSRSLAWSANLNGVPVQPFGDGELTFGGRTGHEAEGRTERGERVSLRIAAQVIGVMANGNLLVEGTQEVLVNHEVRRLGVAGIARAGDLSPDNTIVYDRLAEARITYGGRGRLTEVQQPPWGQQVVDRLSPL